MNNLYFGCTTCHIFVDAGYRHAYWTLEDAGVVSRSAPVDVNAVFGAKVYWEVDAEWQWLAKLLPTVRMFLEAHQKHQIMFGDGEELGLTPTYDGDYRLFDWLMEAGDVYEELPRYYIERMGFRQWDQVVEHNSTGDPPWWWGDDEYRNAAKQKFLSLVTTVELDDTSHAG